DHDLGGRQPDLLERRRHRLLCHELLDHLFGRVRTAIAVARLSYVRGLGHCRIGGQHGDAAVRRRNSAVAGLAGESGRNSGEFSGQLLAVALCRLPVAELRTMPLFTLDELAAATATVRSYVPPTPAYAWPLLAERVGAEVVVKHENHTPTGSFKARGGFVYVDSLLRSGPRPKGLLPPTPGNHRQSVVSAAARHGIPAVIVVPEGNSPEKNAAMEAFGGQLVTAGKDFDESRVVAAQIERERGYHFVPSFHRDLVKGVATYALKLFKARSDLDAVYVPIGM